MKTTKSVLKSFCNYSKDYKNYEIIDSEKVTRTVTHKIPFETTAFYAGEKSYLSGFEAYYEKIDHYPFSPHWRLRSEYVKNRPTYSIEITYNLLTVEFTEQGKERIKYRYELHRRNMEKYAKLMEGA